MPGSDLMLAFFAAAFVFAVMPGPALLYTAAQTLARGRRGGRGRSRGTRRGRRRRRGVIRHGGFSNG